MDDSRFDLIVRVLARTRSRRSALKVLFGGAVVGAATVLDAGRGAEAAACFPNGSVCREHANCCSKTCGPKDRTGRRTCVCPANLTDCKPDGCVDLKTDPQHCGSCKTVAETDRAQTCCNGVVTQLGTLQNCSNCGDDCTQQGQSLGCFQTTDGYQCRNPQICTVPSTSTTSLTQFTPIPSSVTNIIPGIASSLTSIVPVSSSLTVVTPVSTSLTSVNVVTSTLTAVVSSTSVVTSSFTC